MSSDITVAIKLLEKKYGPVKCALIYHSAWQLLLATMLSAQCKDETVNKVTAKLFAQYPGIEDIDKLELAELMKLIYSTGFYRTKAKNVKAAARHLLTNYQGKVPDNMLDLLTIPGVARKTANVILSEWFAKSEGIVVDTHVRRISNRLGWVHQDNPVKIEQLLMKLIAKKYWGQISLLLIEHGRKICDAKKPRCEECFLQEHCEYYQSLNKQSKQNLKLDRQNKQ